MLSIRRFSLLCVTAICSVNPILSVADDEPAADDGIPLVAPKGWRGETIQVPPAFAKNMKLNGVEKIRFAPGMFKPDAKDFFSYVLVFRLDAEPELTRAVLERELLAYYRGLATAVGRGKIKTDGFSFSIRPVEGASTKTNVANYVAVLEWIEPFATSKSQTLNCELRIWKAATNNRNWIFMSVSPHDSDDPIWNVMHRIRDEFLEALADQ